MLQSNVNTICWGYPLKSRLRHNYKTVQKISDEYWDYLKPEDSSKSLTNARKNQPFKKSGIPHVKLEFSIPKILIGHNIQSVGIALIYDAMYEPKKAFEDTEFVEDN